MFNLLQGKQRWYWIAAATILVSAGAVLLVVHHQKTPPDQPTSTATTFDGPSTSMEQTVIVPTLDTPLPQGKSAIWCAAFQLAWDRLKEDVTKGPVKIENAQSIADRLNRAEYPEDSLDPETYYAAAGLRRDGIVKRILADMAKRFPDGPIPDLREGRVGAVAYGYLKAGVSYRIPFFENDEPFTFTDSAGNSTPVKSFGIRRKDRSAYKAMRSQVSILFPSKEQYGEVRNFALDPSKDSQPHQINTGQDRPEVQFGGDRGGRGKENQG